MHFSIDDIDGSSARRMSPCYASIALRHLLANSALWHDAHPVHGASYSYSLS